MNKIKYTTIAIALFGAGFVAAPAIAGNSYDYGHATEQASKTRSHVSDMTGYLEDKITGAVRDSTSAVTRSDGETSKAHAQNDVDLAKQKEKQEIAQRVGTLSCEFGASSNSASASRGGAKEKDYRPGPSIGAEGKAALRAAGSTSESVQIPGDSVEHLKNIAVGGCEGFMTPGSERALICEGLGHTQPGQVSDFPDGDIRASSLMSITAKGASERILSVPESGDARDAREFYLMNSSQPVPLPKLADGAANTVAGLDYAGYYAQYQSVKSTANFPKREYDRLTSSPARDDTEARKLLIEQYELLKQSPATSAFVDGYLKSASEALPGSASVKFDDLSPMDLLNFEAERRVGNPDWVLDMSGKTSDEKISELLMIAAYNQRIEYQKLDAIRQNGVVLGQIASLLADQVYRPGLESRAVKLNQNAIRQ